MGRGDGIGNLAHRYQSTAPGRGPRQRIRRKRSTNHTTAALAATSRFSEIPQAFLNPWFYGYLKNPEEWLMRSA
jgi:hypothetical protein